MMKSLYLSKIDKFVSKIGVLNNFINKSLIKLIPGSTAAACTQTVYYTWVHKCEGWWACDASTRCRIWHLWYVHYYADAAKTIYLCSMCGQWRNTYMTCNPCPD